MAESPKNKNSENTLFMRLPAIFLTIRGNKKEKNQKKLKNGVDKCQTGCYYNQVAASEGNKNNPQR